jgi:hypothetical protein
VLSNVRTLARSLAPQRRRRRPSRVPLSPARSLCHALVAGPISPPWTLWQRVTRRSGSTPRPSSPLFATVPPSSVHFHSFCFSASSIAWIVYVLFSGLFMIYSFYICLKRLEMLDFCLACSGCSEVGIR